MNEPIETTPHVIHVYIHEIDSLVTLRNVISTSMFTALHDTKGAWKVLTVISEHPETKRRSSNIFAGYGAIELRLPPMPTTSQQVIDEMRSFSALMNQRNREFTMRASE